MGVQILINHLGISGIAASCGQGMLVFKLKGSRGETSIVFIVWNVIRRKDGGLSRAALLVSSPGNLVSAATSTKTDEKLLVVIVKGVPQTAMNDWVD